MQDAIATAERYAGQIVFEVDPVAARPDDEQAELQALRAELDLSGRAGYTMA